MKNREGKNEQNLRDLWDIKQYNVHAIIVSDREESKREEEIIC